MQPTAALPPPAVRFGLILNSLVQALYFRGTRGFIPIPLSNLLIARLQRLQSRFRRLAERVAAGRPAYTPRQPRGTGPDALAPRPSRRAPAFAGRKRCWMLQIAPETVAFGSQLQALLAEPEMAGLVAASPPLQRALLSLLRGLGAEMPPGLHPPPRPRKPRPPRPREPRPPRQLTAMRAIMRVAWPGLRRPPQFHGPVDNPWRSGPPGARMVVSPAPELLKRPPKPA